MAAPSPVDSSGSLRDILDKMANHLHQPFNHHEALLVLQDIARGMAHLHEEGVLHRDLAARNVLLQLCESEEGEPRLQAKVADFGYSRLSTDDKANPTMVNPFWSSPESLSTGEFTTKSDVWSFGMVIWEVISTSYPWPKSYPWIRPEAVSEAHIVASHPPPPQWKGHPLVDLMVECWNLNPEQRPDFGTIVKRLEQLKLTSSQTPSAPHQQNIRGRIMQFFHQLWRNEAASPKEAAKQIAPETAILLVGGSHTLSVDSYCVINNTWQYGVDRIANSVTSHTTTVMDNGMVYLVGGYDGVNYLNTVHVYTPSTNKWNGGGMKVPNMPLPRAGHGSVCVNGRLLVMGGSDRIQFLSSAYSFTPHTNQWIALSPMLEECHCATAAVYGGDRVFVVCGEYHNGTAVQEYDINSDTWVWAPQLPERHRYTSLVEHSGRLFVVGGCTKVVRVLDPREGHWNKLIAELNMTRDCHATCLVGEWIFAIGGWSSQSSTTMERYSVVQGGKWELVGGNLPTPREHHSVAVI